MVQSLAITWLNYFEDIAIAILSLAFFAASAIVCFHALAGVAPLGNKISREEFTRTDRPPLSQRSLTPSKDPPCAPNPAIKIGSSGGKLLTVTDSPNEVVDVRTGIISAPDFHSSKTMFSMYSQTARPSTNRRSCNKPAPRLLVRTMTTPPHFPSP